MKKDTKMTRINDEILHETAEIIRAEIKDPRVSTLVSVTKVETSNDLAHCKIHLSVMGDNKQKEEALAGINSASGFIRKLLAERVNLRNTPVLKFVLDDTLDYSIKLNQLINEVTKDLREEKSEE